jgi:hypothetical protein
MPAALPITPPVAPPGAPAPPPVPAAPGKPSGGWLYLLIGAGLVLVAADTRAWPLVVAVLTAAIFYQLGQIA